MKEHDQAKYEIEGKDPKGKPFKATIDALELRIGDVPPEIQRSFDERSRRQIVETANHFNATVRRIKRVD